MTRQTLLSVTFPRLIWRPSLEAALLGMMRKQKRKNTLFKYLDPKANQDAGDVYGAFIHVVQEGQARQ